MFKTYRNSNNYTVKIILFLSQENEGHALDQRTGNADRSVSQIQAVHQILSVGPAPFLAFLCHYPKISQVSQSSIKYAMFPHYDHNTL